MVFHQTIWKICASQFGSFPQVSGCKFKKKSLSCHQVGISSVILNFQEIWGFWIVGSSVFPRKKYIKSSLKNLTSLSQHRKTMENPKKSSPRAMYRAPKRDQHHTSVVVGDHGARVSWVSEAKARAWGERKRWSHGYYEPLTTWDDPPGGSSIWGEIRYMRYIPWNKQQVWTWKWMVFEDGC